MAGQSSPHGRLVLCVDAGGSSCRAALMSSDGEIASGIGGPCNVTTLELDVVLKTISRTVQDALRNHSATRSQSLSTVALSQVWVGLAGYDRLSLQPSINTALSEMFNLPLNKGLKVSSDLDLLPPTLSHKQEITSVIVLVAGTGSVAMSYKRDGKEFRRVGRAGGWGWLLGDDGSGFACGREGIRKALRHCDLQRLRKSVGAEPAPFSPLAEAVLQHYQAMDPECNSENLLTSLLIPGGQSDDAVKTKRIASAAAVVLRMAPEDVEAKEIVESGAASVSRLIDMLVKEQAVDVAHCALALIGGLVGNALYRGLVLDNVEKHCGKFGHVVFTNEPAVAGARYLLESS